ncbi:MAG: hypothetical protein ACRCWM_12335 [Sarcina sp.]
MSKKENQLQENTSHISNISYDIENMLSEGKSIDKVKEYINKLKNEGDKNGIKFPKNLELADAVFDEKSSIGVCAFLDTNTGQTILGFVGTNRENKYGWGDIVADAKIGALGGFHEDSKELEGVNNFIKKLQGEGHNITQKRDGLLKTILDINRNLLVF